jgi:hypothetical protein
MAPEPASAKQRHYLQGLPNARGVREGDCQALLSEARAQVGEGGHVVLFLAEALCKTRESKRELSTVKMQSRTGCRLSVGSAIIGG